MVKYLDNPLDSVFGALSDPTRRDMLEHLGRCSETVTALAHRYDMSLPAVSKHLKVLERAGLLHRERLGREHHLSVRVEPLNKAMDWAEEHRTFWESSFDRL